MEEEETAVAELRLWVAVLKLVAVVVQQAFGVVEQTLVAGAPFV